MSMERPLNIISGSCLLTGEQVKDLGKGTGANDLMDMCISRPKTEELCLSAIRDHIGKERGVNVFWWLETKEFAGLVKQKTEIPYETALRIFIDQAVAIQRILESGRVLATFPPDTRIKVLFTDTPYIDKRLIDEAGRNSTSYMAFFEINNLRVPKSIKKLLSNKPGEFNKLRIAVTYSNAAILGRQKELPEEPPVAIELAEWHLDSKEEPVTGDNLVIPKSFTMKFAKKRFKTKFVLI